MHLDVGHLMYKKWLIQSHAQDSLIFADKLTTSSYTISSNQIETNGILRQSPH